MDERGERRSERFLMLYRTLEGLLEKRYADKRSGSVVMEYLRDGDSAPCRAELDMCREIRNILSHNADDNGEAVVEPSEAVVETLRGIVEYVKRPRLARDCGTPGEKIVFAHPNDNALDLIRHMMRMGFSHVPVRDRNGLVGVFSAESLMRYAGKAGFDALDDGMRVGDLKGALDFDDGRSEKYLFFGKDATLTAVRGAFEGKRERNSRVAAAFVTEDGTRDGAVLAMLTPWDVLGDRE